MLGTSRVVAAVLASSLIVASGVGTVARAQPKAPTPAEKQQAGDLVKQAIAKSQEKDHLGAIDLYLKAYAVVPLPTLLSNVGTEFQQAAKPAEAFKYFCLYLEKDPTGALVTYATSQARVLAIQLGNDVASDADVCKPAVTPPGNGSGSGSGSGAGPGSDVAMPPPPPTSDPGGSMKLAGMIGGGVGLVTLGLGFYFGVQAKKINDDIEDQGPNEQWRNDIRDYMDKGQRYEYMQIGFLVAGGALVVGGTVAYMVGRGKTAEAQQQMSIAPSVTPNGGGVTFSGRF
jgi:serine/threonine-protein kinase